MTVFPGLTVGAPDSTTAATGHGKLVVRGDGTLTPRYLSVGSDNSTGELVVRGPNAVLQQPVFAGSDPDLVIGLFEVGDSGGPTGNKLTVEQGATVDTAYTIRLSESEVLVDGASSSVNAYSLWVNNSSKLTVSGGAALSSTSSNDALFGLSNGSEIVFTGMGTTVDTQAQLNIKGGTLEISDGASVHSRKGTSASGSSGILGGVDASFPGSTAVATVTGAGSSWTQDGGLSAGFSDDGTLNIQDGGLVSNTGGFIARFSGSTGAVTVDGADSTWANSGGLFVGGDDVSAGGTGALTVQNSGLVEVASTLKIWNTGTVSLVGGTIDTAAIDHTDGGVFDFTSGTLHVGTFQGTLTQDGGTLVIGSSPGTTDVTQDYTLNAGTLEIELFGNGGGSPVAGVDFDQLTADTANLGGTLDLVTDPGYTPTLGDLFPIISTTSGVSGTFGTVSGADLGSGLRFGVSYDALDVTLEVVFAGDGNGDGVVDGLDYLLWAAAFGDDPAAAPPAHRATATTTTTAWSTDSTT